MLKLLTTFTTFFVLLTIRACIKSQFCKPVYLFIIRDHKLFGYKTELSTVNSENVLGLIFFKGLFEALIFGGAYMWREICIQKSARLILGGKFTSQNRLG